MAGGEYASSSTRTPEGATGGAALVGRIAELGDLLRVVNEATQGELRVVLLEGDPGVGKTRLLQELIGHAERLGRRVLYGRAREFERGLPYSAIRSALEGLVAEEADDDRGRLATPEWGPLGDPTLPSLSDTAHSKPRAARPSAKLAVKFARLLASASEERPVMLAIDDAHWLDESSVELLHLLAGRLEASSFVLLLAYRGRPPELDARLGSLLRELSCYGRSLSMQLGPLDEWETATLVEGLLGSPADPAVVTLVSRATAGNAFFIGEVVRTLSETGELVVTGGRVALRSEAAHSLPIPLTARALVARRLFALGPTVVTVARAVAVAKSVELDSPSKSALAHASGLDRNAFDAGLDDLCRAGILTLVDRGVLEFTHPLVRTLIYDELGVTERRHLHQALADRLHEVRAAGGAVSAREVAVHSAQSARPGDDDVVERFLAAGDEAFEHAPGAAAAWFERALALLRSSDRGHEAGLHRRRAQALCLAGSLNEAVAASQEGLAELPVGPERTSVATTLVGALTGLGQFEAALHEVNVALAEARAGGRGRLLAHRLRILSKLGRLNEARACGAEALEVIADDLPARTLALCELAEIALVQGRLEEHAAAFAEVLDLTKRLPPSGRALAEHMPEASRVLIRSLTGTHLAALGQLDLAGALLKEAEQEANEHGMLSFGPMIASGLAMAAWLRGRWDEATKHALAAIRESQRSGVVAPIVASTPLIAIATDRGDITGASRMLETVRTLETGRGRRLGAEYLAWCDARLARLQGRPGQVLARLEGELERCRSEHVLDGRLFVLDELVAAHCELGEQDPAEDAAGEIRELARRVSLPFAEAVADRAEFRVAGDPDVGRRARARFVDLGMAFERAQTELLLAGKLCEPALAKAAYDEFTRLGADPWIRRTRMLFKELGLSAPRRSRRAQSEATSLAELEDRIAGLVARGLTNRDVAGVLALSPKTVENYLSRIYRKLGCTNRTQLAAAWLERSGASPNDQDRPLSR